MAFHFFGSVDNVNTLNLYQPDVPNNYLSKEELLIFLSF